MTELLVNNTAINEVKYTTKLHWINYTKPVLSLLIIVPLLVLFMIVFWHPSGKPFVFDFPSADLQGIFSYTVVAFLIYRSFKAILQILNILFTKIFLSSHTLTLQTGILAKKLQDISLNKYEAMEVQQSILGRMLNFGVLTISTGELGQSYLIEKPLVLRDFIKKNLV